MSKKKMSYLGKPVEAEAEVPAIQVVLSGGGDLVTSVNGMTGDVVLTHEHVGAVPVERTVNGKPLGEDVELTADDVGAVSNDEEGIATDTQADDVLDEVFGEGGGIAADEEAQDVLDEVFGEGGGIASDEEADDVLDGVFGDDKPRENATRNEDENGQVATDSDAAAILDDIFG